MMHAQRQELVEKLHLERISQRGIARLSGMIRTTVIALLKKVIAPIATTIQLLSTRPTLEFDELWSYVGSKNRKSGYGWRSNVKHGGLWV